LMSIAFPMVVVCPVAAETWDPILPGYDTQSHGGSDSNTQTIMRWGGHCASKPWGVIYCCRSLELYLRGALYHPRTSVVNPEKPKSHCVSHEQTHQPAHHLHSEDLPSQSIFPHWPKPNQPKVQNRQIARCRYAIRIRINGDVKQSHFSKYGENSRQDPVWRPFFWPGGNARFEKSGPCVELGKSVARTRDDVKELRDRVHEVEYLRYEQEK